MSYTPGYEMTNEANRAVRHCRIGKVTMKTKEGWGGGLGLPAVPAFASDPYWRDAIIANAFKRTMVTNPVARFE